MRKFMVVLTVAMLAFASFGCAGMSNTKKGGGIGAVAGAGLGAIIGKQAGNTAVGAAVGAVVGGTTGALIGRQMDQAAEELDRDLEGVKVERVGEGIKLTFDSGILFAVNKSDLNPQAQANLTDLAVILQKYKDTNIFIDGHTDSDGTDAYNLTLSQSRAGSVKSFLVMQGVDGMRMNTQGYGESMPIADNTTDMGKASNRRVEVAITANEKMIKAVEKQQSGG